MHECSAYKREKNLKPKTIWFIKYFSSMQAIYHFGCFIGNNILAMQKMSCLGIFFNSMNLKRANICFSFRHWKFGSHMKKNILKDIFILHLSCIFKTHCWFLLLFECILWRKKRIDLSHVFFIFCTDCTSLGFKKFCLYVCG